MGKITEQVSDIFEQHRANKIALKEVVLRLCRYSRKLSYNHLMQIFEDALDPEFDELGNIRL
jgi:hypothetical protein